MVKNILKYSLFGLAASFAFAAFTIYLLEPRENLISELPQYWQVIWLVLLNAAGIVSHFAARLIIPFIARISKKHEKMPIIFLAVFWLSRLFYPAANTAPDTETDCFLKYTKR